MNLFCGNKVKRTTKAEKNKDIAMRQDQKKAKMVREKMRRSRQRGDDDREDVARKNMTTTEEEREKLKKDGVAKR